MHEQATVVGCCCLGKQQSMHILFWESPNIAATEKSAKARPCPRGEFRNHVSLVMGRDKENEYVFECCTGNSSVALPRTRLTGHEKKGH